MTSQVALVTQTAHVTQDDLSLVGAAIQKQVTRDFGPVWGIAATVDVFPRLEDVPVGYWHLLICDTIPGDDTGIHQTDDTRQPYALVGWTTNWSLTTSHEVLEMLVDPFGNRLLAGDSPMDQQGRVSFLVEVCDPCQAGTFGYAVNGVLVSDFCTPDFYGPSGTSGARYSFTGAIQAPRQVIDGGYLTWLFPATGHMWQQTVDGGRTEFSDCGTAAIATACLREKADATTVELRRVAHARPHRDDVRLTARCNRGPDSSDSQTDAADVASHATAASLRRQIGRRVRSMAGPAPGR